MKRATSASAWARASSAGMVQGLGVELLPLVDIEQQPVGAALLLGREQAADAVGQQPRVGAEDGDLVLDLPVDLERRQVGAAAV